MKPGLGGGQDIGGEGVVQAEVDSDGSVTVDVEEANVSHSGGGSQRKRAVMEPGLKRREEQRW